MTAVEWLIEQLKINNYISENAHWLIDDAKEMEKQQIKECWKKAQDEQRKEFSSIYCSISADKYYNETFKTK
jgi:hypothetical protein